MLTIRPVCAAAIVAVMLAAACRDRQPPGRVVLATTTSVANSGLLDALILAFRSEAGIEVRPMLVGSGRALQMLVSRNADVAITHAPEAEAKTLNGRSDWLYRKIMFNDFVLVGPPADPAQIASAPAAGPAMQRIAASGALFVSRGDSSGTHERERRLWALAGAEPAPDRIVIAGSGMGSTLRIAGAVGAYTLTDRATFAQHAPQLPLAVLFDRDPELLNTYAVIVPAQTREAHGALRLAEWLSDGNGRRIVEAFTVGPGQVRAFSVWPMDAPRDRPDAVPQ